MKKLGLFALLAMPMLIMAMDLGSGKEPSGPERKINIDEREHAEARARRLRREAEEPSSARERELQEQEQQSQQEWKQLREGKEYEARAREAKERFQPISSDVLEHIVDPYVDTGFEQRWRAEISEVGLHRVSFSHNGKLLAIADFGVNVYVLDAASGKLNGSLVGHEGEITTIVFSPDDTRIVTADDKDMVIVWDVATKKMLRKFRPYSRVFDINAGPYGMIRAATRNSEFFGESSFTEASILDLATGSLLQLVDFERVIGTVKFSHDGKRIAIVSTDGAISFWDVVTGKRLNDKPIHFQLPSSGVKFDVEMAFSFNNQQIAIVDRYRATWIFDIDKERPVGYLPTNKLFNHSLLTSSVHFSPDGRHVVTAHNKGIVCVWDVKTEKPQQLLQSGQEMYYEALFSPNGNQVVAVGLKGSVTLWERFSLTEFLGVPKAEKKPKSVIEAEERARAAGKREGVLAGESERNTLAEQFKKLRSRENIDQLLSPQEMKNLNDIIESLGKKNVTNQDVNDLRKDLEKLNETIEQQSAVMAEGKRAKAEQERLKVIMKQQFKALTVRAGIESLLSKGDMGRLTDTFSYLSKNLDVNDDQLKELQKLLALLQERVEQAEKNKSDFEEELAVIEKGQGAILTESDRKLIAEWRRDLKQPVSAARDTKIQAGLTRLKKELRERLAGKGQ